MSDSDLAIYFDESPLTAGMPPYSLRGARQTLAPIDAASNLKRTVNGALIDLSGEQFRKLRSTISGEDQQTIPLGDFWPGRTVFVECIAKMCYMTGTGTPARTAVAGSSYVDGDFTFYRPLLIMKIVSISADQDEYSDTVSWSIDLEEV